LGTFGKAYRWIIANLALSSEDRIAGLQSWFAIRSESAGARSYSVVLVFRSDRGIVLRIGGSVASCFGFILSSGITRSDASKYGAACLEIEAEAIQSRESGELADFGQPSRGAFELGEVPVNVGVACHLKQTRFMLVL
jgi:hypothetical protein